MPKSKIFLYLCLAFIFGLALSSFFDFPFLAAYIILLISLILIVLFWQNPKIRLIGLAGIFLFLGILRFELAIPKVDENKIQFYNNERVTFVGTVSEYPDRRIDHAKLTVEPESLKYSDDFKKVSGKVLIKTDLYPEYDYGDKIQASCKLIEPEPIEDFAYDKYLARFGIYSLCYNPNIKLIEKDKGNIFWSAVYSIKNKSQSVINQSLSEPAASIFSAMSLGNRRTVPQDLIENFSKTGISHIIAISGMHITIVAGIFMSVLLGLHISRRKSFYFAGAALFLFVVLVGLPASAVRAGTMGFLVLLAMNTGRVSRLTNSLVLVAVLMLLANPLILRYDIGFQLSFLAVLSLMYFSDFFERFLNKLKIPDFLGAKGALKMTLSAQILVLPLIAYNFKRVSIIAPLANVLIIPLLPFIMILGFIALLPGFVFISASNILFWPVWLLLTYLIKVVQFLSGFSFSHLEIQFIPWYLIALIYAIIFAWIYVVRLKKSF